MHVKVVKGKAAVGLYECDAVKCDKESGDTIILPLKMTIDRDAGVAEFRAIEKIVLPRDGDIVYVENSSGGTIDTFRAGEELPTGRPVQISDKDGQAAESEPDRERVFRGLPRGTGPEDAGLFTRR